MNFPNNIDILIMVYGWKDTLEINLQMLRKDGVANDIYIATSEIEEMDYYNTLCEKYNIKKIIQLPLVSSKLPVEEDTISSFQQYYDLNTTNDYVLFTYQDVWSFDTKIISENLNHMICNNYSGMNFYTKERNFTVPSVLYFVLHKKYIPSFYKIKERGLLEQQLYEYVQKITGFKWHLPTNCLYDRYNYQKLYGTTHVHTLEQKYKFIRMWEERTNKKLIYDDIMLKKETRRHAIRTIIGNTDDEDTSYVCSYDDAPNFRKCESIKEI